MGATGFEPVQPVGHVEAKNTSQICQPSAPSQVESHSPGHLVANTGHPNVISDAPPCCTGVAQNATAIPADLQLVIDRWSQLPEAVKTGIVAIVKGSANE